MINLSNFLGFSEGIKFCSIAVKYVLCFSGINVYHDGGIDRVKGLGSETDDCQVALTGTICDLAFLILRIRLDGGGVYYGFDV